MSPKDRGEDKKEQITRRPSISVQCIWHFRYHSVQKVWNYQRYLLTLHAFSRFIHFHQPEIWGDLGDSCCRQRLFTDKVVLRSGRRNIYLCYTYWFTCHTATVFEKLSIYSKIRYQSQAKIIGFPFHLVILPKFHVVEVKFMCCIQGKINKFISTG